MPEILSIVNGSTKPSKQKFYYKGMFGKIHEVEILAEEKYPDYSYSSPHFYYKYLIKFKRGKMKHVDSHKLIFGKEDDNAKF